MILFHQPFFSFVLIFVILTLTFNIGQVCPEQEYNKTSKIKSAHHLVRPLWMDPKETWRSFLRNADVNERRDQARKNRRRQQEIEKKKLNQSLLRLLLCTNGHKISKCKPFIEKVLSYWKLENLN